MSFCTGKKKSLLMIIAFLLLFQMAVRPVRTVAAEESAAGTEEAAVPAQTGTGETSESEGAETETPVTPTVKKKKTYKPKWVKKDGYAYYLNERRKKTKGLVKIGKKFYYFDKKGRQKHGWQKIGDDCYYFYLTNGKKGYMARNTTINGFKLKRNGKARGTSGSQKMYCLLKCSQIIEQITKPSWSVSAKMSTAWHYMQNNYGYWNVIWYNYPNWGVYYTYQFFINRGGSCEGLGCAWAFLANACGASNCYCVCSGGHGWAEVNGLLYDPACARYNYRTSTYYGIPSYMWGHGGIQDYHAGCYRYKV